MTGQELFLKIPNYDLAACYSRNESKRGGSCVLVHKQYKYKDLPEITKMSLMNIFECCAMELIDLKIIVICVYRVPKQNNLNLFFKRLEKVLDYTSKLKSHKIVIAGDFNIDVLKNNNITLDLECLFLNHNMKLAIRQPTRLASKTCIDNFAISYKKCKTEVLEFGLSDHTAQIITIPVKKTLKLKYWRQINRDYRTENINKFVDCIKSISFSDVYSATNPTLSYNRFMDNFNTFYDLCFPKKTCIIKVCPKPKWVSRGIKICSKKKKDLLWKYRLQPNITNKLNLNNYTKLFKKIIYLTKMAQNSNKIKTSVNKSKTTWQIINQTRHNLPKEPISKIKINDTHITEPLNIATAFNDYFIQKIIPVPDSGKKVTRLINNQTNSMFMAPSSPYDIHKIIKNLKNTNSVGVDDISTKIIKAVGEYICHPLSYIINQSIEMGIFPQDLKLTLVKPLFKKENKELMEYYRPIALISIFSKIFEKYYYNELNTYLEKNYILCDEQKGFRRNKTINMAVYEFLKNVMCQMDKTSPVCAIYCDMTQAFDYVDHNILVNKLDAYGIRGNILDLIRSYLTNRFQITEISKLNYKTKTEESYRSKARKTTHGVPQGSVLGPLLFIIYINDMPKSINHPISLFADDSTVTIKHKDGNYKFDINNSLTSIIKWLDNNNLKINLNKTNIMHFSQRTKNNDIKLTYQNNTINEVESTKFLGLTINNKLNWKDHINEMTKKISSSSYVLHKLSTIVSIEALLTAYYGLVESVLRYGIIFWGNSTDKEIAFKIQKRCLRAMFHIKTIESCKPLFTMHRILTLPSLYILEVATFVKTNPHLFPHLSETVTRNRRDEERLRLFSSKTALLHKSIFCMAPIIFNKIPTSYKQLNSHLFKKKLKLLLIDKCYYNVQDFLSDKL